MEVQVAETGPCSRSLQITITSEQVTEHLEQVYAAASKQVQIKGFRAGKVPRKMLEKMHGPAILSEAKEQLLNRYFGEACREKEINPVGRIQIDDVENLEVKPGEALAFTAKIDVKPEFEIPDAKGIEIPAYEPEANDEDVDNALKEIAHQRRKIQTVDASSEDAAAQDGDFVKCDYTFVDESGGDVHEKKGVQLNTRIPITGVDAAAYTEALVGKKAGESTEMPITFADNFEKEEQRGKSGTVRVQLHEVLRVTSAPIDDELAKGLEFETVAELREDLKKRISMEKERIGKQQQEEAALDHLGKVANIDLPPSLIEEQQQASLGAFAQRMQQEGMPDEQIQQKLEESKPEAQQDAERRVRMFFLIEAVAQQQELTVAESDVNGELANIAAANSSPEQQVTPAQVYEHLQKENRLGELQLALLERKVRDFLRENGKTVDKKES
ncbi:MAG: trigger factor [Planctomycetota bacterium]